MNFDFHVHGVLSSKLAFDPAFFQQMTQQAISAGLDAIALTDHFDAPSYAKTHRMLAETYEYCDDTYVVNGLKVFPGIEVEISEGMHLLAIANREDIAAFYERLLGHLEPENYCNAEEYFALQEGLNLITIAAHPFRLNHEITRIDECLYTNFDAMGLNARDMYFLGEQILIPQTQEFSRIHDLPIVAGSDTHHFLQIGSIYNEFPTQATTIDTLRALIRQDKHKITIHQSLREKINQAREEKRIIKATQLNPQEADNER